MPRSSSLLVRLAPVVALGVGSWVGLGRPTVEALEALSEPAVRQAYDRVAEAAHATRAPPRAVPARGAPPHDDDRPAPSVDARLLPDPNPWPSINADASVKRAWLLAEGPVPRDGDGRRLITLTFDDGPFPETTPVVLRVLERHHVRATFFWIGRYLDGDSERAVRTREVALQVREAGHLIGTHTHDHVRLVGGSHAESVAQIDRGMASVERAVGVRPAVFRPPFGQLDPYGEMLARERGLTLVLWNVETEDLRHTDAEAMARNLEEQVDFAGGGVVLLHDIRFSTAETLDRFLTWVDHHRYDPTHPATVGYDVVDFAEFTRATAASPQPFASRAALEEARAATWRRRHPESRVPVAASDEAPLAM
jgi:peptidoglycan/xylan/chitin deacetylase (PgdA/CDA1 family)